MINPLPYFTRFHSHFTLLIILPLLIVGCTQNIEPLYPERSVELDPLQAARQAEFIKDEVALEVADGLQVQLWAGDTLVQDPIAISVDDQGRIFYTSGTRLTNSEFDIRAHRNWMTASISFETVEDRRAFLKATFSEQNEEGERFLKDLNQDGTLDWKDLTVEKEQVWFVEDVAGSGFADRAQLYLEDFHEEITDLANGIEAYNGEVFIAVGPDLWRTLDRDKDGVADKVNSISHGFAVHIGFGAHGMSGAKIGPDGRIWWGIGDIGMNVIDQDGKNWKYPNQGVIVRSELDGSGFEVYSAGLRNTHEFTFDKYGNLISVDNDGDHQGERERLVYLINGSETGWRINWQFGKYTDPENNDYKVWMEEKLHLPHWEGQAAYILPP
ncbi:MAG: heme-binding protein, partial [Cyclobacteriaceae bacterium]|nr:heme-binding protein [Cyclobacteriaceae bacterium]